MTKNLLILSFIVLPLFSIAQSGFDIKGNVKGLGSGKKIFLVYTSADQQITDSAMVQDGAFNFKGKVAYPVYASLFLNKNPYVNKPAKGEVMDFFRFYLENSPINMLAADSLKKVMITGSPGNKLNKELRSLFKENDAKIAALGKSYEALPEKSKKDSLIMDSLYKRERELLNESYRIYTAFAASHPDSYISLFGLTYAAAQPELAQEVKAAYQKLAPELKKTPMGKDIPVLLASQELVKIGKQAPDFEQTASDGKPVRLSDFKKSYVLVDFWASWCGPCRAENPNLVAAFQKYKPSGFNVLGVSLDNPGQKRAWLDAISKDQLNWTQVSDLKGWDNSVAKLYGVRAIPANFLIDPAGNIIATDLKGDGLNKKLEEIFKNHDSAVQPN